MCACRTPREASRSRGADRALQTEAYSSSRAQTCLKDRSSLAKMDELPAVILVRVGFSRCANEYRSMSRSRRTKSAQAAN
jgi:hypothetical protein